MIQQPPIALLAELTHRCPLSCPYCSNPLALDQRSDELDTATWVRVFEEAAALGVLHLHLSGGEPGARRDLTELVAGAATAGLYTNLITSGIGLTEERVKALDHAGLDHVQLSLQDTDADAADRVAGYAGAHQRKIAFAEMIRRAGLPLTVNVVIHRSNISRISSLVALAIELGARRVEIAHAQYYGWGLKNRDALMPELAAARAAGEEIQRLKETQPIVIDYVPPDHFARYPKPCVNGWGRQSLNITPRGKALPCHAAETIQSLEFWNVRDRSLGDIWLNSPAFNAFRGDEWMPDSCKNCPRKEIDFGGCRCQALALTGDAHNADPACVHSPHHDRIQIARSSLSDAPWTPRR